MRRFLALIAVSCLSVGLLSLPASAQAPAPASQLTVTQWVQPESPGAFTAKVIAPMTNGGAILVRNARVTLLGRGGMVHQGITNEVGEVTIPNVEPGIYAMVTKARGLFASYAMHVLEADQAGGRSYAGMAEISCAQMTARRFETMSMPYINDQGRDDLAIDLETAKEIHDHVSVKQSRQVLINDGSLAGNLYKATKWDPASMVNVFLFKENGQYERDVTDEDGAFEFTDLRPGIFSLVGAGPDGISAVGFELVAKSGQVNLTNSDGHTFVNMQPNGEAGDLNLQVVPVTPEELQTITNQPLPDEEEETGEEIFEEFEITPEGVPMAGPVGAPGPPPPSGFGGSPGTGSGSGGSGLAAAGLIGAAAIIAATDDDNFVPTPQLASPLVPGAFGGGGAN